MTGEIRAGQPRWNIAPYFVVDMPIAEFKSRGVKITRDLCDQPYGCRDFDVEDCNGYRLCFGQNTQ